MGLNGLLGREANFNSGRMITDFLLKALHALAWLVLAPVRALPTATLPSGISDNFAEIGAYVSPLNVILPLTDIAAILALFLAIEAAILMWKGINWLLRRIPTQS